MGITIGLPFFNAEDYLELAIKSVFAQTYTNWELLLIDDGSTDRSLEIAKSINDPRVTVYSDGKNKKLAARLNEIVKLAKYDFIARMDADDLMSAVRIKTQMDLLVEYPHIDLISTGTISITNDLKYIGSRGNDVVNITHNQLLYKIASPLHASIVGRAEWFKRNKYDESLKIAQDYELWLRSSSKNDFKIKIIPNRLYYYREENNATAKKVLAAYKNERIMFKKYAPTKNTKLLLKSYAKSAIVKCLSLMQKEDLLLKRRSNSSFNNNEMIEYKNQIALINGIRLPNK